MILIMGSIMNVQSERSFRRYSEHSAQVTRSVVPHCTSEKFRSPRAVFALASDGTLTLYVHYRAPNQYHGSFKTNSYAKFSQEIPHFW